MPVAAPELPQCQAPACCGPEPPRALLCFCWLLALSSGCRTCSVYSEPLLGRYQESVRRLMPFSLSLQGPLLRWLKVNFSEAFIAWIHIKALRVFVESVLRCVLGILGWRGERQGLEGKLGNPSAPCSPPALLLSVTMSWQSSPFCQRNPVGHACPVLQSSPSSSRLVCVPCLPHLCALDRPSVLLQHPRASWKTSPDCLISPPPKGRSPGSSPLKEESYTCKHYFISSSVILKLIEPLWKIWKPYRQAQV